MCPVLLVLRPANKPSAIASVRCQSDHSDLQEHVPGYVRDNYCPTFPLNRGRDLQRQIPKLLWWNLRGVFNAEILLTDPRVGMVTQMVRVRAGNQLHLLLPLRWAHCPVRELQWARVSCLPGQPDQASFIIAGLLCSSKFPNFPGDCTFLSNFLVFSSRES